jgi:uncharacterized protein (DUF111 family)
VSSVEELAASDPVDLARRTRKSGHGDLPIPTPAEIRVWIRGAQADLR